MIPSHTLRTPGASPKKGSVDKEDSIQNSRGLNPKQFAPSIRNSSLSISKCVSGSRDMFTSNSLHGIWKQSEPIVNRKFTPSSTINYTAVQCTNGWRGTQRGILYLVFNASALVPVDTKFAKKKSTIMKGMGTKWRLVVMQYANDTGLVFFVVEPDGNFNFHQPYHLDYFDDPGNQNCQWFPINLYISPDAPKYTLTGSDVNLNEYVIHR